MLLERLHQMRCGLIRYVASKWLCLGWEMLVNPLDFIEWFMCTCDFLHLAVPDSLIFIKKKYNYYRSEKALSPSPFPSEKALLHAFNVVVIFFFFWYSNFPTLTSCRHQWGWNLTSLLSLFELYSCYLSKITSYNSCVNI